MLTINTHTYIFYTQLQFLLTNQTPFHKNNSFYSLSFIQTRDLVLSTALGFTLATVYWEYYSVPRLAVFRDYFATVKLEYEESLRNATLATADDDDEDEE